MGRAAHPLLPVLCSTSPGVSPSPSSRRELETAGGKDGNVPFLFPEPQSPPVCPAQRSEPAQHPPNPGHTKLRVPGVKFLLLLPLHHTPILPSPPSAPSPSAVLTITSSPCLGKLRLGKGGEVSPAQGKWQELCREMWHKGAVIDILWDETHPPLSVANPKAQTQTLCTLCLVPIMLGKSFPEWDIFPRLPAGKVYCGNLRVWIFGGGLEKSFSAVSGSEIHEDFSEVFSPSSGTKATLS